MDKGNCSNVKHAFHVLDERVRWLTTYICAQRDSQAVQAGTVSASNVDSSLSQLVAVLHGPIKAKASVQSFRFCGATPEDTTVMHVCDVSRG